VGANGTARGRGLCRRRPARRLSNASVDGRLPRPARVAIRSEPVRDQRGTRFWPCSFLSLFLPLDARWSLDAGRWSNSNGRDDVDGTRSRRARRRRRSAGLFARDGCHAPDARVDIHGERDLQVPERHVDVGRRSPSNIPVEEFIVRLGPFVSEHTVVLATINWLWIALLSASVLLIATTGWLRAGIALASPHTRHGRDDATRRVPIYYDHDPSPVFPDRSLEPRRGRHVEAPRLLSTHGARVPK